MNLEENLLHPGFFNVCGYDYAISREGRVVNTVSNKELKGSTNPAGYHNFRLSRNGVTLTWGRHRLLLYVFLPREDYDDLVVNHKNGIKGFDALENLEWMTVKENIYHAALTGLSDKLLPVQTRDVFTGEVRMFPSSAECAREVNISKDAIHLRLKKKEGHVFPEGLQYRSCNFDEDWVIPKDIEKAILENGRSRSVYVKNVWTNEVLIFNSSRDACKHVGVKEPYFSTWVNNKNQPIFLGKWQVKLVTDERPWRVFNDVYEDIMANTARNPVVIINEATKEESVFIRPSECAKEMDLKATTLNERLKSKFSKVYSDGFRYGYLAIKRSAA